MELKNLKEPKEFGWYNDDDFPSLKGMNVWLMSGETQPDVEPYLIVVTDQENNDWEYGLPISINDEFSIIEEFSESNRKTVLSKSQEVAIRNWIRAYRKHLLKIWNGKMTGFEFCDVTGIV